MESDLRQFANQELGSEYRHVKDFVTTAPPPGGYTVKASQNGETAPGYDPYGGKLRIVVDPHMTDSFEFEVSNNSKKQEELKSMVQYNGIKQYPDDYQREKVISTLRETSQPAQPPPVKPTQQRIVTPPAINNEEVEVVEVEEHETVLPLVETNLTFVGSPFSTEACFNDVFEDATKKWLFLVYYNSSKNRVSRTNITKTDLILELRIKGRDIGYKLDVTEPIIAEFDKFSFIILKIVDAVVV